MAGHRILGVVLGALLLAGCSKAGISIPPQPPETPVSAHRQAACRNAMEADYEVGWPGNSGWPPASYKPVCARIGQDTLLRLMDEALDDLARKSCREVSGCPVSNPR